MKEVFILERYFTTQKLSASMRRPNKCFLATSITGA
jgi:hypothetical protein